jgi:putative ABC transport system permease protein
MLPRLLRGASRVHPAQLALVVLSTAMGSGIAVALATVSLQVEDRLGEELRSFGANVLLEPAPPVAPAVGALAPATLEEQDLRRILTIFWRHNVVGVAPSLTAAADVTARGRTERAVLAGVWFDQALPRPEGGGVLRAGIAPLFPHWQLDGRWPAGAGAAAVLGHALAARLGVGPGDLVRVVTGDGAAASLPVAGVVRTGGFEEEEVLVPLEVAQALTGRPGRISRALVSAVTVPLDAFGRRDPAGMTPREYEKWSCTPYVTSVARQLQEAVPGSRARPVWSVAEAEARVVARLDGLVAVLAALTLAAAALAVASTFAARVTGRRVEIALMRACGASAAQVAAVLGAEALALGVAGGLAGAGLAWALVRGLGIAVFGTPLVAGPGVVPLAVGAALLVAAVGTALPIRRALALDPAAELKEAA